MIEHYHKCWECHKTFPCTDKMIGGSDYEDEDCEPCQNLEELLCLECHSNGIRPKWFKDILEDPNIIIEEM